MLDGTAAIDEGVVLAVVPMWLLFDPEDTQHYEYLVQTSEEPSATRRGCDAALHCSDYDTYCTSYIVSLLLPCRR